MVSRRIFSIFLSNSIANVPKSGSSDVSKLSPLSSILRRFSSIDGGGSGRSMRGEGGGIDGSSASDRFADRTPRRGRTFRDEDNDDNLQSGDDSRRARYANRDNPRSSFSDRPFRGGGDRKVYNHQGDKFSQRKSGFGKDDDDLWDVEGKFTRPLNPSSHRHSKSSFGEGGNGGISRTPADSFPGKFNNVDDLGSVNESDGERRRPAGVGPGSGEEKVEDDKFSEHEFLEKFKLGARKREKPPQYSSISNNDQEKGKLEQLNVNREMFEEPEAVPQDADEIFKKMKETGLIPNAVAMLDGLCKDGLVQEAMKLFGLMREKGTFPEVVIYTAVVDGFCKAQKFDDAKRIFRKMQNNGISPNAFSYTVLVQGLCKGKRLEDAVEFCVEMLEAGHSPNVATFVGLVYWFCKEKDVEEARSIIERLIKKGYFVNEKAIREYLDKKGPFSPSIREAIFGKKSSQLSF